MPSQVSLGAACIFFLFFGFYQFLNSKKTKAGSSSGTKVRAIDNVASENPLDAASLANVEPSQLAPEEIPTVELAKHYPFVKPNPSGRLQMGLGKIEKNDWLRIEKSYEHSIEEKLAAVAKHPHNCVLNNGEKSTLEGMREMYEHAIGYMAKRFPKIFIMDEKKQSVKNVVTGRTAPLLAGNLTVEQMVVFIAENCEEDMLLMQYDANRDEYVMTAGLFGFPAGFHPIDRINFGLAQLHERVPMYAEHLQKMMDKYFLKLPVGTYVSRCNWTIHTNDNRYSPEHTKADEIEKVDTARTDLGGRLHLRVERQCLTKLPKTQSVIFSLRTYLTPFDQIKKEGLADELLESIHRLPATLADYKGYNGWGEAAIACLEQPPAVKT